MEHWAVKVGIWTIGNPNKISQTHLSFVSQVTKS